MTFGANNPLPDPLPNKTDLQHPRMKVFQGILYIVRKDGSNIRANRLNASTNATTWLGETILAVDSVGSVLGVDLAPGFSFDFGPGADGTSKFRMIYTAPKSSSLGIGGLKMIECNLSLDPASCQILGWSTLSEAGNEASASLRFGGGQWVATWRKAQQLSAQISTIVGRLQLVSGVPALEQRTLYQSVIPCAYGGGTRWGEYNDLDSFGDGRFFAPYTINGPGCRWQGQWSSDAHVGGSAFGF